ncbi:BTAD domain-containing putative transcriptional regulator [Streptomyces sp. NPDC056716]|uniref:AfsR/SARP family transcriptional regulator n=1 Tax=unclassified Streptomyces TaxID=2593676 RepID=UPI0036CBF7F7
MEHTGLRLRLLGPVELLGAKGTVPLGTPKQRCLLAALALAPGKPVPMDTLVTRLWGESAPVNARSIVYTYVSRLRHPLRQAGGGAVIQRGADGYRLDIPAYTIDLHQMRRLGDLARRSTSPETAARLLGEAEALWWGPPLTGLRGPWADSVRQGLRRERRELRRERFAIEVRRGRHEEVIRPLSGAVADNPLDGPLVGLLMLALYRSGSQVDALELHRRTYERYRDDLGMNLDSALQRLHRLILTQDQVLERREFLPHE